VLAAAFGLPKISIGELFHSRVAAWLGIAGCLAGLCLLLLSLISFGTSFRVGIDARRPDKLVTTGVFAHTRNPIYVAFALILVGQLLVLPDWILLAYTVAGFW